MKRRLACAHLALLLAACAEPPPVRQVPINAYPGHQAIQRVAVVAFKDEDSPMARIEALAIEALVNRGYVVVNLADVDRAMREAVTRDNGYFDRSVNAQNLGRLLRVDALFILQVTSVKKARDANSRQMVVTAATATARLIDSERGSTRWIKSANGGGLLGTFPYLHKTPAELAFESILSAFPTALPVRQ